ncbi:hypothetical protein I79_026061 [Cricetulus griseus]|uniref:Uncharacterized protein n=1 Tax=Cricetulus griseus TaxID=10029 RepID=G3IPX6_CRIGR|nr:hypothetical protein I79_026061 [Cricetulus griseus]
MHYLCVWCQQRSEEGIRSPGPGVIDGCDLSSECWEPNLGPLQEQPVPNTQLEHQSNA